MSTCIGIRCKNCDKQTGCGCKLYWKLELINIINVSNEIRKIHEKTDENVETRFLHSVDFDIDPTDFVAAHDGHDMHIYDEYGYDYDSKGERKER